METGYTHPGVQQDGQVENPPLQRKPVEKKWVILLAQVAGVSSALSIIILLRVLLLGGPTPTKQNGGSSPPTPTTRNSRFSPKNGKEKPALEVDGSPDVTELEEDLEDLCFRNRDLVHKIEWSPKMSQNEEAKQASKVDGSSDMPDLQDLCFRKNRDLVQKIEWSPKTSRSPAENECTKFRVPYGKRDGGGQPLLLNKAVNWHTEKVLTDVRNGRPTVSAWKLDRHGFEFAQLVQEENASETAGSLLLGLDAGDFYTLDDETKSKLYEEVEALVAKRFGAERVEVFHHIIRNEKAEKIGKKVQKPAAIAHIDFSDSEAETHLKLFKDHGSTGNGDERYVLLNVWKSIDRSTRVQNNHLAVLNEYGCAPPSKEHFEVPIVVDGKTIACFCPLDVAAADSIGVKDKREWVYFPGMTSEEVLLFKQFDSDDSGARARRCFYTSICEPDEHSPPKSPRQSIEFRVALVLPGGSTEHQSGPEIKVNKQSRDYAVAERQR